MRRLDSTLDLWRLAVESEGGIAIGKGYLDENEIDQRQLIADLYQARKEAGDPRLFQYYIHNAGREVWLVKGSAPEVKSNGEFKPLEDT